jgi:hypothetical protein
MRFFDENVPYWGNTSTPLIGAHDGRLTARSVKIFADGMYLCSERTAWSDLTNSRCAKNWWFRGTLVSSKMCSRSWLISVQLYEPYTDNPSTNGFMRLSSEVLFEFIPRFLRDGWQVVRNPPPLPPLLQIIIIVCRSDLCASN